VKAKSKYKVRYTLDDNGMWMAHVVGLPGCFTQGRTIEQTRERAREAIQAVLDLPQPYDGELSDDVVLGSETKSVLIELHKVRAQRMRAEEIERTKLQAAIRLLTRRMSLRDAGELVGVSRQRVHQLYGAPEAKASRRKRAAKIARG
jgi:predicted RNase H-like HicB family nuclease